MDQENKTALELAADTLKAASDTVAELIGESHPMVSANITHQIGILYNRLVFLHGGTHTNHNKKVETEPVTQMFGQKIETPKKVVTTGEESEIDPKELERRLFADKVDKLQLGIFKLEDKVILESYQQEQNVIRGVAKRAGLEDFKTAEINSEYLGKIRLGLQEQIRKDAAAGDEKNNVPPPAKPVTAPADTNLSANKKEEDKK